MPTPEAVALSTAVTDAVIARILPVGEMICAPRAAVLVDSPAGAGKTFLIESVAAAVRQRFVGELAPRILLVGQTNAQVVDLAVRVAARLDGAGLLGAEERVMYVASAAAQETYQDHVELSDPSFPAEICSDPELVREATVVAATVDKLAASPQSFGLFQVGIMDEAYQCPIMKSAMTAAAERWVLVGDPGQIAPFSAADLSRWQGRSDDPIVPLPVALRSAADAGSFSLTVEQLPVSWRLPAAAVPMVRSAFYPLLRFQAATEPSERQIRTGSSRSVWSTAVDRMVADGWAHLLLPPGVASSGGVDDEVADGVAGVVISLLESGAEIVADERPARIGVLSPGRIAVGVSHTIQADMVRARLAAAGVSGVQVDTANRLQGLEFDVTVVWHPLSGMVEADEFHLDAGRMCVLLTRHRHGCVVVGRESDLDLADHPPVLGESGEGVSRAVIEAWEAHTIVLEQLAGSRVFVALEG